MRTGTLLAVDPALPSLAGCLSPVEVARRFEEDWPDAGPATAQVLGCSLHDVRYEPGVRCVAAWWLDVRLDGRPPVRTAGVAEVDVDGLRHRLHTADAALPGLREACDAAAMRPRLGPLVGADPRSCTATLVRYRPGERAVLRYRLQAAGTEVTLFGKLRTGGVAELAAALSALHQAAGGVAGVPDVGAPLAVLEDLTLLVQAEAPGRSLKERLFGPDAGAADRLEALRAAGTVLAGLHSCPVRPPVARTFADDGTDLRRSLRVAARISPDHAAGLQVALDAVEPPGGDEGGAVPSHGSFRPDHLLFHGGRAFLVDLDGFCAADPARDAGNLLAHLAWKAIREPEQLALAAAAPRALLGGYATAAGGIDRRRVRAYQALTMVRIGVSRLRNLTLDEWHLLPRLAAAAAEAGRAPVAPPADLP